MAVYNGKTDFGAKVAPFLTAIKAYTDIKYAGITGQYIGGSNTFATLPTTDVEGNPVNEGDTVSLTTADGGNPRGLYKRVGSNYVLYLDMTTQSLADVLAGLNATQAETDAGAVDNKFVTPLKLQGKIDGLATVYHPLGGNATVKVVGADAEEATQEFVTANQLAGAHTTAEAQTILDNA